MTAEIINPTEVGAHFFPNFLSISTHLSSDFFPTMASNSSSMNVDDTLSPEAVAVALYEIAGASRDLHSELQRLEAAREAQHARFRALLAAHEATLPPLEAADLVRLNAFLATIGRLIRHETRDVAHVSVCVAPSADVGAEGAATAVAATAVAATAATAVPPDALFQTHTASTWSATGFHHWITIHTKSPSVVRRVRAVLQEIHEGPQSVPQEIKDALATEWHDTEDVSTGRAVARRLVYRG